MQKGPPIADARRGTEHLPRSGVRALDKDISQRKVFLLVFQKRVTSLLQSIILKKRACIGKALLYGYGLTSPTDRF